MFIFAPEYKKGNDRLYDDQESYPVRGGLEIL